MKLSVIIVSWNTLQRLRECLQSIYINPPSSDFEVIVVDNASSDGSPQMMRDSFPTAILIESSTNLGFGAGNNQAAKMARGELLILLNPDTIVHPGTLQDLIDYLDLHPEIGAVGPRILNIDGTMQFSIHPTPTLAREAWRLLHLDAIYPLSRYNQRFLASIEPKQVDVVMGSCLLIRKEIISKIGLFDEQFFMYSEEVDLCTRLKKAGWQVAWLPSVAITHVGGESTKQLQEQMFLTLYESKIKYFRKHYGTLTTILYKGLLYLIAITRWMPGILFKHSAFALRNGWYERSRLYQLLIFSLSKQ